MLKALSSKMGDSSASAWAKVQPAKLPRTPVRNTAARIVTDLSNLTSPFFLFVRMRLKREGGGRLKTEEAQRYTLTLLFWDPWARRS